MRLAVAVAVTCLSIVGASLAADAEAAMRRPTDIPAQPLDSALQALAKERDRQMIYPYAIVGEKRTGGAHGELTFDEALLQILSGTGLGYRYLDERTVTVVHDGNASSADTRHTVLSQATSPDAAVAAADRKSNEPAQSQKRVDVEEVVVTGTHIRGAQLASPVTRITQEEMRLAGQSDLGAAIRALPQNFSGGQNPGVALGAADGSVANQNLTGASSLNLRGLGPDATLTLLNGRRLPYDSFVQAMDISVIPAPAVDRLEILLDGASSIYGSDAVGGVANVILKRDYSGAEVSARYGLATDGGAGQTQFSGVGGTTWSSGGFLVAGDISRNSPVRAGDRDYLAAMPNPDVVVYPHQSQQTFLLNGHQSLSDSLAFTLAAYHAKRETNLFSQTAVKFFRNTDTTSWGVLPGLSLDLPSGWSLGLDGVYGRNESDSSLPVFFLDDTLLFEQRTCYCNRSQSADLRAEGPIFAMRGGPARLSIGAGYMRNSFESIDLFTGAADTSGSSRSHHAYGELYLPVIGKEQGLPFVEALALNAAARYEHYDTFGDVTTPRFGLVWDVLPSLQFKASWGKSFKVPTLTEQFQPTILNLNSAAFDFPDAPAGSTYLLAIGGNRNLGPERAEVTSAGITIRPSVVPGLRVELGWFEIDYSDRVVAPLGGTVNLDAPEFVTRSPTVEQQNGAIAGADQFPNFSGAPYDPATVIALFDNRFTNASAQRTRGLDLSLEYTIPAGAWTLTTRGIANWLEGDRRNTPLSPETPVAGVVFFPPHVHARASVISSRGGLALATHLNYVGGVDNIYVTPQQEVSSMLTLDLVVEYQAQSEFLGNLGLNLALTNAFDRHPPFMQPTSPSFVSYDSTNYSVLGRVLSATVTKRF